MLSYHSGATGWARRLGPVIAAISLLSATSLLVLSIWNRANMVAAWSVDASSLQTAGLSLEKNVVDAPAVAGGSLNYVLNYTNNGPTASKVCITDTLDAGMTSVTVVTQPPGWLDPENVAGPPATLAWCTPSLEADASGTFEIQVTLSPDLPEGTSIRNHAIITSDPPDGTPDDNVDEEVTDTVAQVSLTLEQTNEPDPVVAGSVLTYYIPYGNDGPSTATGVTIVDKLPEQVLLADTLPVPDEQNWPELTWKPGDVPPGKEDIIRVAVRVPVSADNGSKLANAVTIDSDQTDPRSVTAETRVQAPVLSLAKFGPSRVRPGAALCYTIVYTNSGEALATDVEIVEGYDARTQFVNANLDPLEGTENRWIIGDLEAGVEGTILVTVTVAPSVSYGTRLTNTVVLSSRQRPSLEETWVVEVDKTLIYLPLILRAYSPPSISCSTKEAQPAAINAGETLTYTLSLHNTGTEPATGIVLTDVIPIWATFVPASDKECQETDGVITWSGTLHPGQPVECQFSVKAAEDVCQAVTNTAKVSGDNVPTKMLQEITPVMVSNGGFKTGTTDGWQVQGDDPLPAPQVVTDTVDPDIHYLRLGTSAYCNTASPDEPGDHASRIKQTIDVPNLSGRAMLNFRYRIFTFDHLLWTSGKSGDSLDVYVADTLAMNDNYNNYPAPVPGCSNLQDSGWRTPDQPWGGTSYPDVLDLTEWKGKSVEIRFELWTRWDGYYNTWAYLDDVKVVFE